VGALDAYVVHSNYDDAPAKWVALECWRINFRSKSRAREPTLFIDRVCMAPALYRRPAAVEATPVYLGGAKSLLVLAGETFARRLWCVTEVLLFLSLGGSPSQVHVATLATDADALQRFAESCEAFDVREAQCHRADDAAHLRGLLTACFGGDVGAFNTHARAALAAVVRAQPGSVAALSRAARGKPAADGSGDKSSPPPAHGDGATSGGPGARSPTSGASMSMGAAAASLAAAAAGVGSAATAAAASAVEWLAGAWDATANAAVQATRGFSPSSNQPQGATVHVVHERPPRPPLLP